MTPDVTGAIQRLDALLQTLREMPSPANLGDLNIALGAVTYHAREALGLLKGVSYPERQPDIRNWLRAQELPGIKHAYKENGKPDMCAVCGFEWVDTQAGFDTCEGCLKNV